MKPPLSKVQKPRVRKLKPLSKPELKHHLPPGEVEIKSRWKKTSTCETVDRQRREVTQLRELMVDAVASKELSSVQVIMEQLLGMVERENSGVRSKEAEAFRAEVVTYLERCEVDLKALVEQEVVERNHQRFHGNELMRHVVELLHTSPLDERAITKVLDQAEQAYRRAHDRRAECIPGIRHKVAAEGKLSEASRRFDACEVSAATAIARSASEQYAAFRSSPTYQSSQLLLSLSEGVEPWNEKPLRELSRSSDVMDECFQDVEAYFQDKARTKVKTLYQESKRFVDERRYADARDALNRCEAYQNWLQEPMPVAIAKYKHQLLRTELVRELRVLEEDAAQCEATAKLLKWAYDCKAGLIPRDDLVESGILRFALKLASGFQQGGGNRVDTAAAVVKLIDAIVGDDSSVSALKRPSSGDVKTAIVAFLRLTEALDHFADRAKALTLLYALVDSKQLVHIAIHKCSVLETWCQLRETNASAVDVLLALTQLLHRLVATSFPLFLPIVVKTNTIRGVISTFGRHFKQPTVARACMSIFTLLCTASDLSIEALSPMESGLSSSLVNALRHYAQEPAVDSIAVTSSVVTTIFCLCETDIAFAKVMEAAKVPAFVSKMAANPVWQLAEEHAQYFQPKHFRKRLQEGSMLTTPPLGKASPSFSPSSLRSNQLPSAPQVKATAPADGDVKRMCAARFGVSVKLKRRHQFCLVRFLVPLEPSQTTAEHCCIVVTFIDSRTQSQVYAFPANNAAYSIAVLRRELVHPSSPRARCDFFRALLKSLQPIQRQKSKS